MLLSSLIGNRRETATKYARSYMPCHEGRHRRPRQHRPTGVGLHLGRPPRSHLARGQRRPSPETRPCPRRLVNAGAELCIIDTAPHASDAALAAARAADLILIPSKPSVADVAAVGTSIDIARTAGKATVVVINQATAGSTLIAEAHDAIASYDVRCAPVVVHQRLDHVRASTNGLAAQEYVPRGKAAAELDELWDWARSQGETGSGESQ